MIFAATYQTDWLGTLLAFLGYGLFLVPAALLSLLVHYLCSVPMRRRDRAVFFLDFLETAIQRGQSVEHAILSAAEMRDKVMGIRFFMVAAHVENGKNLGEALTATPPFLPPQVTAILRAGERLGNLKNVLPACRETLRTVPDTVRSNVHYMAALLLVFAPISLCLMSTLAVFVIPKFNELAQGMQASLPLHLYPVSKLVLHHTAALIWLEAAVFCVLLVNVLFYVGGPGLVRWFQYRSVPVVDWLAWRLPWKHKMLQRTFSAMLSVLLDGGVPEAEAVQLAGEATANEICRRRAARIVIALQQGVPLEKAVQAFDDTGEFQWRLTNATHAQGGFLQALRGWHEVLDAKAFQQQETAAQGLTSGLVILNGVVVAIMATGMFGVLIAILKGMLDQ